MSEARTKEAEAIQAYVRLLLRDSDIALMRFWNDSSNAVGARR